MHNGSPLGDAPFMKNFARLVRFALPYKVRFGLSVGCAAMVALLFFAELGAVYPLLHILFNSQNPQKWIAEKIESFEDDIAVQEARQAEARYVIETGSRGEDVFKPLLRGRREELDAAKLKIEALLHQQEIRAGDYEMQLASDAQAHAQLERLEALRRDSRLRRGPAERAARLQLDAAQP